MELRLEGICHHGSKLYPPGNPQVHPNETTATDLLQIAIELSSLTLMISGAAPLMGFHHPSFPFHALTYSGSHLHQKSSRRTSFRSFTDGPVLPTQPIKVYE